MLHLKVSCVIPLSAHIFQQPTLKCCNATDRQQMSRCLARWLQEHNRPWCLQESQWILWQQWAIKSNETFASCRTAYSSQVQRNLVQRYKERYKESQLQKDLVLKTRSTTLTNSYSFAKEPLPWHNQTLSLRSVPEKNYRLSSALVLVCLVLFCIQLLEEMTIQGEIS